MKPHFTEGSDREGSRRARWHDFATREIWQAELDGISWPRVLWLRFLRVIVLTVRGIRDHRLIVQSAALSFITLLSIIPLLAVSFSVARGLGAYDALKLEVIEPALDYYLPTDPAPARGAVQVSGSGSLRDALDQIVALVDRTNDLPLGILGLVILLYGAVKLLTAVERSLNEIWGLRRGRTWSRRLTDYIAFVVVTPVLLLLGSATTAALRSANLRSLITGEELETASAVETLIRCAPVFILWVGLSFAYTALPNTRVRLTSALIGGGVASVLWLAAQFLFLEAQVGISRYNAIYGVFASMPILMIWIFLTWTIFLLGAELTYAHQTVPLVTSEARMGRIDQSCRESLALRLAGRVADTFLCGREPQSAAELAGELVVAPRLVNDVLFDLVEGQVLKGIGEGEQEAYVLARDPEEINVLDVLHVLRAGPSSMPLPALSRLDKRIDRLLMGLAATSHASLHNFTLRELSVSSREEEEPEASAAEQLNPREAR